MGLASLHQPSICASLKASPLGASVAKSAKSFAWNGTQKSIFKHGSAGQTMLGFIVELRMCPHLPSCEHNALLPTVIIQSASAGLGRSCGAVAEGVRSRV